MVALAAVLEGGYDLDRREGIDRGRAHRADPTRRAAVRARRATDVLEPLKKILRPYWHL